LLNDTHPKYYTPSGHLAVAEVTVFSRGRVIYKQYIPRNTKVLE
jgi:hypothetical protein